MYSYAGVAFLSEIPLELPNAVADQYGECVTLRRMREQTTELPAFSSYAVRGRQTGRRVALGTVDGEWVAWLPPYLTARITVAAIDIYPFPGVGDGKLDEHIVGNVLPFWLAATGRWAFHGSAVTHPGLGCVAVLGPTHSGKSTTAAVLTTDGWALIADDTTTGQIVNGRVMLDSTSDLLHVRGQATTLIASGSLSRRGLDPEGREMVRALHADTPVALDRLLFLNPNADPAVVAKPLSPVAVAKLLLDNSRVAAWIDDRLRTHEFDAAVEIATLVPGCEIAVPGRFATAHGYAVYVRRIVGTPLARI